MRSVAWQPALMPRAFELPTVGWIRMSFRFPVRSMMRKTACLAFASAAVVLQGCAVLPEEHVPTITSNAIPVSKETELGRLVPDDLDGSGMSAVRPLAFSAFALDARLALIRHAQRSIDIQYYLLQDDTTGRVFLREVGDAARRGVRVRLLVDDLYTASSDRLLSDLAALPNVQVRLFNPFPAGRFSSVTRWSFALLDFGRLNHRMHNKLLVVDGAFAVAGGRNIADEYFFRSTSGNFIDFDLLVSGTAVADLERLFDVYWNSHRVRALESLEVDPRNLDERRDDFEGLTATAANFVPLAEEERDVLNYAPVSHDIAHPPLKLIRARVRVVADDPEKVSGRASDGHDKTTVTAQVIEAVGRAKEEALISSPYFVPGATGLEDLELARARRVAITLITNSMAANDEPFVSAAYGRYRKRMLKAGIQIYEISPGVIRRAAKLDEPLGETTGRLHAKALVIDHQTTFVGSMNFDFRSSRLNTELGLFVESPELASDVVDLVSTLRSFGTYRMRLSPTDGHVQWIVDTNNGEDVFDSEPEIDGWTKLKLFLFSPFIDEGLL